MTWAKIITAISILVILFALAYGLFYLGIAGPPAPTSLRSLGAKYLEYMLGNNKYYTASSPEGVTAILWDYRGLDTLYETMVLFAAVIASVLVYREYLEKREARTRPRGLSLIVRSVSKIILWLTIIVSVGLGLTGQLTPGGGFVGGAAFAVVPVLVLLAYSVAYNVRLGITKNRALLQRTIALLCLSAIILVPLLFGGYVFQNQLKPGTSFSYPGRFLDGTPLGGSLFFLNAAELFAVAGAFTLAFILLGLIAGAREEAP